MGGLDSKTPKFSKIALRCAQDDLGVKKVLAPSKSPVMCFARIKKTYTRTIGTLIGQRYLKFAVALP
jgi:hypothetical protein